MGGTSPGAALRVGIVFGTFPPERNGGADFVARLASALAAEGADVHVLTSPSRAAPQREVVVPGVSVHRVVDEWALTRAGRVARRTVESLLAEERVDVLHVFFPDSVVQSRYQLPATLGLGRVPLVTTFWNLGLGRRSPLPIKLMALALLARSAVLSSHDPSYLRALRLAVGGRKPVRWLPVGSNLEPPHGGRRGPREGDALLGYFGHLDFTRGIEDLFGALAQLRRTRDVRLAMVGGGGERFAEYAALADGLGIAEAVRWTGWLPPSAAAGVLAGCDVCVLPYRRTSLGRSALAAALELGLPTVVGGTPEGIEPLRPGVHVELARPADPESLATTIALLLDDGERRSALAAGARRAARLFAWPRIAAGALALYREALSAPRTR